MLNNNFAKIGKSILISILGPRDNCMAEEITGYIKEIDRSVSGCESCHPYIYSTALPDNEQLKNELQEKCNHCKHKCYIEKPIIKKKYLSEKTKYSIFVERHLPKNALLIFILLHYYCDSAGIIRNISIKELSEKIGCTPRTILNSLRSLCQDHYIYLSLQKQGRYSTATIAITQYKSYFLNSREGGRGYLVLDTEILNELLSIKSVVALRIYIRAILKVDDTSLKTGYPGYLDYSYKEIHSCLPRYCKPNVIKNACSKYISSKILQFIETDVGFHLSMNHCPKEIRQNLLKEYSEKINYHIKNINQDIDLIRSKNIKIDDSEYKDFLQETDIKLAPYIQLSTKDIEDISLLLLQYEQSHIRQTLVFIYQKYYIHKKTIDNLGGLIRTILYDIGINEFSKVS